MNLSIVEKASSNQTTTYQSNPGNQNTSYENSVPSKSSDKVDVRRNLGYIKKQNTAKTANTNISNHGYHRRSNQSVVYNQVSCKLL